MRRHSPFGHENATKISMCKIPGSSNLIKICREKAAPNRNYPHWTVLVIFYSSVDDVIDLENVPTPANGDIDWEC